MSTLGLTSSSSGVPTPWKYSSLSNNVDEEVSSSSTGPAALPLTGVVGPVLEIETPLLDLPFLFFHILLTLVCKRVSEPSVVAVVLALEAIERPSVCGGLKVSVVTGYLTGDC